MKPCSASWRPTCKNASAVPPSNNNSNNNRRAADWSCRLRRAGKPGCDSPDTGRTQPFIFLVRRSRLAMNTRPLNDGRQLCLAVGGAPNRPGLPALNPNRSAAPGALTSAGGMRKMTSFPAPIGGDEGSRAAFPVQRLLTPWTGPVPSPDRSYFLWSHFVGTGHRQSRYADRSAGLDQAIPRQGHCHQAGRKLYR